MPCLWWCFKSVCLSVGNALILKAVEYLQDQVRISRSSGRSQGHRSKRVCMCSRRSAFDWIITPYRIRSLDATKSYRLVDERYKVAWLMAIPADLIDIETSLVRREPACFQPASATPDFEDLWRRSYWAGEVCSRPERGHEVDEDCGRLSSRRDWRWTTPGWERPASWGPRTLDYRHEWNCCLEDLTPKPALTAVIRQCRLKT